VDLAQQHMSPCGAPQREVPPLAPCRSGPAAAFSGAASTFRLARRRTWRGAGQPSAGLQRCWPRRRSWRRRMTGGGCGAPGLANSGPVLPFSSMENHQCLAGSRRRSECGAQRPSVRKPEPLVGRFSDPMLSTWNDVAVVAFRAVICHDMDVITALLARLPHVYARGITPFPLKLLECKGAGGGAEGRERWWRRRSRPAATLAPHGSFGPFALAHGARRVNSPGSRSG